MGNHLREHGKGQEKNVIKESDDLKHFEKTLMTAFREVFIALNSITVKLLGSIVLLRLTFTHCLAKQQERLNVRSLKHFSSTKTVGD